MFRFVVVILTGLTFGTSAEGGNREDMKLALENWIECSVKSYRVQKTLHKDLRYAVEVAYRACLAEENAILTSRRGRPNTILHLSSILEDQKVKLKKHLTGD